MFSKHRLEALSDGIFAIVMTLLILDLKVPMDTAPGHLWEALRQESHTWISFLVTFLIAARYWTLQHRFFALLERIEARTVTTTFIFLGFIAILPFSTSLWGHHLNEPLAVVLYFVNQAAVGVVMLAELEMAKVASVLTVGEALRALRGRLYILTGAMATAAVASWFLPTKTAAIITAIIAAAARRLRSRFEDRKPAVPPPTSKHTQR